MPWGFGSVNKLREFKSTLSAGLANVDPEAEAFLRGSAVTGKNSQSGAPFDSVKRSDLDLAIVSPKLVKKAKAMGIELRSRGNRTVALYPVHLRPFGLSDLANTLSKQTNRKVSFMIYASESAIKDRGTPYISLR